MNHRTSNEALFASVSKQFSDYEQKNEICEGMASTITAVRFFRGEGERFLELLHVGDCRLYRLRGGAFQQLTDDHNEGNLLLKSGVLTSVSLPRYGRKNVLTSWVSSATPNEIQFETFPIEKGDRFLIASDGYYSILHDEELIYILASDFESFETKSEELVNRETAHDDATAFLIEVA